MKKVVASPLHSESKEVLQKNFEFYSTFLPVTTYWTQMVSFRWAWSIVFIHFKGRLILSQHSQCNERLVADWPYVCWLMVVSVCFLYNAAVIPLRAVFPYQTKENVYIWQYCDLVVDLVYIIDIIAFKSHRKFLREGFWIKDPVETRRSYFETLQFKVRKSNFVL